MVVLDSDLADRPESPGSADSSSLADSKISVIVVAAEQLFRLGLARLLGEDERLDVIGVSEGQPELVDLCAASSVDVVLVDLDLTKADSIDLVRVARLGVPGHQVAHPDVASRLACAPGHDRRRRRHPPEGHFPRVDQGRRHLGPPR